MPKFNLVDFWHRYEWQGHGSTHNYGLYYCGDAPHPDQYLAQNATELKKRRLAKYWGYYISAVHPDPHKATLEHSYGSPLSLAFDQMVFDFHELATILTKCYMHSENAMFKFAAKLMNKSAGQRDYSAQEVCHILFNLPLTDCSHTILNVNLHCEEDQPKTPWARPRILKFYPLYSPELDREDFSRVKLMLHHPFRQVLDVRTFAGQEYQLFLQAYQNCLLEDVDLADESSWNELAGRLPSADGVIVDEDNLGSRPVDLEKDWNKEMKTAHPVNYATGPNTSPNTLQSKQRLLFDLIVNHYQAYLDRNRPEQLLLNLNGQGGTGKTYAIEVITSTMDSIARALGKKSPIIRCAPTGVAAFLILGKTIHSTFRIPIRSPGDEKSMLPPIARRPMFDTTKSHSSSDTADVVMRQQGSEQASFHDALARIREEKPNVHDWLLLMKRCSVELSEVERNSFNSALRICAKRIEVAAINHNCLQDSGQPILILQATHDSQDQEKVSTKDAGNLHNQLPVFIGARVVLLDNIWTERSLVNRAMGVVDNILWQPNTQDCRKATPKAVLVAMDKYDGLCLYSLPDGTKVIPVFPLIREFTVN
ncbi:hypothetical protein CC80DRAFT_510569 [Byssothecium circinans]|uniref:ATP-dependent DNA helicase n=1 Tax=Byssothecium circinans TaxID=147558 RepID=A0A6A5TB02_9PLEO|nr:hypothetical protein CC80DRAFT_510569 [Byssothecium circinans]